MSMKEKLQVFYIESPQAMGLQLYYESRDLSLLVLLPEDIDGLDEVKGSVYSYLPPFLSPLVIFVFFLWVYVYFANACKITLVMFDSVQHHWPTKFLCPWDSIDKNTGVGSHFLLQGNFLTQGLNLCLLSPALAGRLFTTSTTWEYLLAWKNNLKKETSVWHEYGSSVYPSWEKKYDLIKIWSPSSWISAQEGNQHIFNPSYCIFTYHLSFTKLCKVDVTISQEG